MTHLTIRAAICVYIYVYVYTYTSGTPVSRDSQANVGGRREAGRSAGGGNGGEGGGGQGRDRTTLDHAMLAQRQREKPTNTHAHTHAHTLTKTQNESTEIARALLRVSISPRSTPLNARELTKHLSRAGLEGIHRYMYICTRRLI